MSPISATPTIVVTNPIHPEVRTRLEALGHVEVNPSTEPWSPGDLLERLRTADAMMGFMTDRVDAALLEGAPRLRVVACALKGYDSYDVDACTRAGVWVSIVPDLLTEPTAELALGLAISLARNIRPGDALVRAGHFRGWRTQLYGTGLAGATVAVVGLGRVGQAILARLTGFGCARLLGIDPESSVQGTEPCGLEPALAQADFVFVAAPLTAGSHHLLGPSVLANCKPGQFIVNVGRGSVVNEDAVADCLEEGRLAGYAADVFAFEDWALPGRPEAVSARLRSHANTLFTPHLGSAVRAVRMAIEHRAADNMQAVLEGREPMDAINRPVITGRSATR